MLPTSDWWECPRECHQGAVDGWYPEQSPGTTKVELPGADNLGSTAFRYKDWIVWPADNRVFVERADLGVEALVTLRYRVRDPARGWDLPWDGFPPTVTTLE